MSARPVLARDQDLDAVEAFVAGLQTATDAEGFNAAFADDVLWGSPFGAVIDGYDAIHGIHAAMFPTLEQQRVADEGGSRYDIEHARRIADDVAIAFVRRSSPGERTEPRPGRPETFDELALFVLVRRDGAWWLAAGLHTPDRRDVYET